MERSNTIDYYDNDDDDWNDITFCDPKFIKVYEEEEMRVSIQLDVAGGGSHAWSYVLKWYNDYDEPLVYITTPFTNVLEPTNKTLILRDDGCGCQEVKLVEFNSELPEDGDYTYHNYICYNYCDIIDQESDDEEEEEEEEDEEQMPTIHAINPIFLEEEENGIPIEDIETININGVTYLRVINTNDIYHEITREYMGEFINGVIVFDEEEEQEEQEEDIVSIIDLVI